MLLHMVHEHVDVVECIKITYPQQIEIIILCDIDFCNVSYKISFCLNFLIYEPKVACSSYYSLIYMISIYQFYCSTNTQKILALVLPLLFHL